MPSRRSILFFLFFLSFASSVHAQAFAALCNGPGLLCVSSALVRSELSIPLDFTVIINSPDPLTVTWEVSDSTGQILESSSTNDFLLPTQSSSPQRKTLHVKDYFLKPAQSQTGMLILTPSRFDPSTSTKTVLAPLKIPVRFSTATTQLTYLLPSDAEAFHSEIAAYMDDPNHQAFSPKTPFAPHSVLVLQTDPAQVVGATAEVAARAYPGQGPWHVIDAHRDGDTAHLTIAGDGWAGVSFYLTGLYYVLTRSVLSLPGISHVQFDPAPSP